MWPELVLIKQTLTGPENYAQWARDLRRALIAKNKVGFIDDIVPMPMEPDLVCFWNKCNILVQAWIINCLAPKVSAGISPNEMAKEM